MTSEASRRARFREACDAAMDRCRVALADACPGSARSWTKQNVFGQPELVSEADLAVQKIMTAELASLVPEVPLLAEEDGPDPWSIPGTCIIVDPIDGTVPFVGGSPFYTITACLVEGGGPVQAAVDFPAFGVRVLAHAGRGIEVRGAISRLPRFGPAAVLVSPAQAEVVRDLSRAAGVTDISPVPTTSVKMTLVALGCAGAAMRLPGTVGGVAPWDYAAAALIVHEAGGTARDEGGRDLARSAPSIVNGWLAYRDASLTHPLRQFMARSTRGMPR